jgi:dihydropteroate synthase
VLNKEKLDIRKDHSAYLGRELEKAYVALMNDLEYVQDDELDLNKKVSQ